MSDFPEDVVALIAQSLDHPSVFMCGPSQRNLRKAAYILSLLPPAAQAVLKGEAVAVPREATKEMIEAGYRGYAAGWTADHRGIPKCIEHAIAASPYAKEPR